MGMEETWKSRWETWDIRVLMLISLGLQIILISLSPLRKRVSKSWITMLIWCAYLLADVAANFAVGLISNQVGSSNTSISNQVGSSNTSTDPTLLALWAPFLLLHLGGPDTITAFSLEDNELWLRHFLGLGFQCWAVGYAYAKSYSKHSMLGIPTLLIFLAGVIKYIERTRALYLASTRIFKDSLLPDPDPGPNYAKLMDEYTSKTEANLPTRIEMIPEPPNRNNVELGSNETQEDQTKGLTCLKVVQTAHTYYGTFKGMIGDMIFSTGDRDKSRDYFLKRTARDAFHIVEVELNFFYDILYTKAWVVRRSFLGYRLGYPLHIISFSLTCAALVLFRFIIKKKNFDKFDIAVSYTLLAGAIALDSIAFVKILYSDWFAVTLTKPNKPNRFITILQCLLAVERVRWPTEEPTLNRYSPRKIMQIMQRRWSKSLSQYNFLNYCLHPRMKWREKFVAIFGLTNFLDGMKYVNEVHFPIGLEDLIFDELKQKSKLADDLETAKKIFSARGDWILWHENHDNLLPWVNNVNFDESLILWHIATELCYHTDKEDTEKTDYRKLSKCLSDYLLYLLVMQSTMLSDIAGIGQRRFKDTCAEAKKFFSERKILEKEKGKRDETLRNACTSILNVNTKVNPNTVKGDRSKSVLFDACMLAKKLKELEMPESEKWKLISQVWVELLSYAACQCRGQAHMAQLSKGGQLLTLVWLLMAHLGLGDQFQIKEGHARAKLIVMK